MAEQRPAIYDLLTAAGTVEGTKPRKGKKSFLQAMQELLLGREAQPQSVSRDGTIKDQLTEASDREYYDGNSRSAGKGTRNYVIFPGEEKSLKILERE